MTTHFRRSLVIGTVLLGSLAAVKAEQGMTPAGNTPGTNAMPAPLLDHDEMAQLDKARAAVFAAHPDLKAENEKLKAMHDASAKPTDDQRNATFAEWKDYQKKMRAELLKVDPTLKPVFAKIDNARKNGATPAPFQPAGK